MVKFSETVRYVEFDDLGNIRRMTGVCKAKDLQKKGSVMDCFWDDDVFLELGIRRID